MKKLASLFLCLLLLNAVSSCVEAPGADPETYQPPPPALPVAMPPGIDQTNTLIFAGVDSWEPEVESLKVILANHGAGYRQVTSPEFDAMSLDEMAKYNLIIFPGGNSITMAKSLSKETHARIREAVQERGVAFLGFCAGAWLAVSPMPEPDEQSPYGFALIDAPILEQTQWTKRGVHHEMLKASFADGSKRDLLWYGGPITPDKPGSVVAKYPDGKPAISQMSAGKGFIIISGLHPAVSQEVIRALGSTDSDGQDYDLGWKILNAALRKTPLQAF